MWNRSLRSRAGLRSVTILLVAATVLVPTAGAAAGGTPKQRPHRADGWTRVYPKAQHRRTKKKQQTTQQSAQPPRTLSVSSFGMAAGGNLQNLSPDELGRELDVYRAAGSKWIRIDINWEVIQAGGPSSYNWAPFDRVVQAAHARGLETLAAFIYTPAWARPGTNDGRYPPTDLMTFAGFCQAAVARYMTMGVHAWEVWNEPNRGFWKPAPDPARYAQMLRVAYDAIKRTDARAFVVSAGLSPYGAPGQSGGDAMNPVTFLEKMYAAGAGGHFDALGWHPYEWGVGVRFHPMSAWSQLAETSTSARSVMVAHGDGQKQIWGTEYGAPTLAGAVSEAQQAELVKEAYTRWSAATWSGPLFWYSARDAGLNPGDREDHFGLVRRDFSPKASFSAYRALAAPN